LAEVEREADEERAREELPRADEERVEPPLARVEELLRAVVALLRAVVALLRAVERAPELLLDDFVERAFDVVRERLAPEALLERPDEEPELDPLEPDVPRLGCGMFFSLPWGRGCRRDPTVRALTAIGRGADLWKIGVKRSDGGQTGSSLREMFEHPEAPDTLASHIRAATRADGEKIRLTARLVAAAWPGGTEDRTDAVGRGWLRIWGPVRVVADVPPCGCAQGHCLICN
jgi:hypothetical protein